MSNNFAKEELSSNGLFEKWMSPLLSKDEGIDPEQMSEILLGALSQIAIHRNFPGISGSLNKLGIDLKRQDQRLEQKLLGCHFTNPIGLAAGFDKNGVAAAIWDRFGFGFAEIGTVTWHPQKGNPKPRLFRLAAEKAALNRMGFNNNGAKAMKRTLQRQRLKKQGTRTSPIGINFGKSKVTSLEKANVDYASSLRLLSPLADYAVVNVSSPNTPGLRDLQNTKKLRQILESLKALPNCPPLLVKIAPDLSNEAIDELGRLVNEEQLAGVIAVNTSLNRLGLEKRILSQSGLTLQEEPGGLSGAPLRHRALEVITRLRATGGQNLVLIGVGGIDSPKVAWERITAGASLIQIYTGWIFQGPNLVPNILDGLLSQIERHGFRNISDAVGSQVPWI